MGFCFFWVVHSCVSVCDPFFFFKKIVYLKHAHKHTEERTLELYIILKICIDLLIILLCSMCLMITYKNYLVLEHNFCCGV